MVTEVLQTQEAVEVTQTRKQEGSGQLALPGVIGSQVGSTAVPRTGPRGRRAASGADPCTSPCLGPCPRVLS